MAAPAAVPAPLPTRGTHLAASLSACTSMPHLLQLHSQLVRLGLASDNDAAGRLIKFAALHDPHYALRLFHSLPSPDPFIYHALLRSPETPLDLYPLMLSRNLPPNNFTFPCLLSRVAGGGGDVEFGRQVHAHVVKFGYGEDGYAQNNLVNMYLSFGMVVDARKVFDRMGRRDAVSWTTMISGYGRMGLVEEARRVFDEMPDQSLASWNAMIAAYVQS